MKAHVIIYCVSLFLLHLVLFHLDFTSYSLLITSLPPLLFFSPLPQSRIKNMEARTKGEASQLQRTIQQLRDSLDKATQEQTSWMERQREEAAKKEAVISKLHMVRNPPALLSCSLLPLILILALNAASYPLLFLLWFRRRKR